MLKKLLLGSLLSGTALFIWGFLSWMVLPWHNPDALPDTGPLTQAVRSSITKTGVYMLPSMTKPDGSARTQEECDAAMKEGPMMYAVIRPGGNARSMGHYMLMGWLSMVGVSLVFGYALSIVPLGYSCLVKLSGMIGLITGLMCWLPQMNWWEYPVRHALPYIADDVIMSLIAGAILAKFVARPGAGCSSPA